MSAPSIVLTGFGPFLDVLQNPSGRLAEVLAADPPAGIELHALVLPVSFTRSAAELERGLAGLQRPPDYLVGTGVQRGGWFRLERRARARLDSTKPDAEGRYARELDPLPGGDYECALDLLALAEVLRGAGATDVRFSDAAGGYVCERTYHALLGAAARLGAQALFLHLPPLDSVRLEDQVRVVRALLRALAALRA